jgi:hypothetical protein
MSPVQVACPACGGPIEFKVGSAMVLVCPYCRSVVARGDRLYEDLGKVAALVQTDSVLGVGRKGRYRGVPFELTGRTQLGHEAGGVWDEWYAAFADGRWGWLAEAQGRFYLTFEHAARPGVIPPFENLPLGRRVQPAADAPPLSVTEKGDARAIGAEGEIPFRLVPGATYHYADLSGRGGEFATLDYGDTPTTLFLGREVSLDDLGVPETARAPGHRVPTQVEGIQLACPQCGGALELRAPDKTERVACPNCGALLDASQGQLRFLKALKPPGGQPLLPFGTVGRFGGKEYITIGWLIRSITDEGVKYLWEEFLLYHPRAGFRWLVQSDGHWSWVEPLPPGSAHELSDRLAERDGEPFKVFQKEKARVEHVLGEFYWKVSVGETALVSDYIHPPRMLSKEVSLYEGSGHKGEVDWSLETYLPVPDLGKAFGRSDLPRPPVGTVAPNQPFPHRRIYLYWLLLTAALLLLGLVVAATGPRRKLLEQTIQLSAGTSPQKPLVVFSEPFELRGGQNVLIEADALLDNAWVEIGGDLVRVGKDTVVPFDMVLEYYHGFEGGENWKEGNRQAKTFLSAQPAGKYRLRLEIAFEKWYQVPAAPRWPAGRPGVPAPKTPDAVATKPGRWVPQGLGKVLDGPKPPPGAAKPPAVATVHVVVRQGVPHVLPWILALFALAVIPVGVMIYHLVFEVRRWKDSEYSPFHSK